MWSSSVGSPFAATTSTSSKNSANVPDACDQRTRRCIVVVISDFRDKGFERALKLCAIKHDMIAVVVDDPLESALPPAAAVVDVRDPETGADGSFDLRYDAPEYAREEASRREELDRIFRSSGLEAVKVTTGKPSLDPLLAFFRKRAKRRSR